MGEHMLALIKAFTSESETVIALPDSEGSAGLAARAAAAGLRVKRFDASSDEFALWLKHWGPDILHVHAGIGWEGHQLARAGRDAEVPVIRTEHLPHLLTDPAQITEHQDGLDLVSRLIAVSDGAAETFRQMGIAPNLLCAIQNGVEPVKASGGRTALRRSLGITPSEAMLLCVARFTTQKGHATLVTAFSKLRFEHPEARLVLAGDGSEREDVELLAQSLGVHESISFLGRRSDVPQLLQAADFFVLPSHFEGLPLVLLEAMSARLPVIVTRAIGSLEAIGFEHPFLAEIADAESLHAALRKALRDPALAAHTADAARKRFEDRFHVSRMAEQTKAVYAQVLAESCKISEHRTRMTRTRIGFIGTGGIAHRHLGVLEHFEDVELAAFCDTDEERARNAAERFGARAFSDHREMLKAAELDAVYICVPPFAHGEIEADVVAADLPFFVEKPLSLKLSTAETINRLVEKAGLVTAVGYHWRYLDTVDEARDLLSRNPARLLNGYWLDSTPPPQWWWRQDRSGGQVVEQTTHILDLARVLAGEVDTVFAVAGNTERHDFPGLDVATASTATLRFASGAVGSISSTCMLRWNHRVGLNIFADGVAIEMTDHDVMIDVGQGRPVRHAEGDPVWREDRDFIDAVQGKENRIRCPYGEALKTHRLALAINESAAWGRPVDLRPVKEAARELAHV